MHHKFTSHGARTAKGGECGRAVDYLLAPHDHKGEERPEIQVLRGDPYAVATVADTLDFSRTYTSGVISWAPEEAPTDAEIAAVLDDWEKLAFAGLEPDRYAFTAVMHREESGVHIHTLAARVDLKTGKSLNIAPPKHLKVYDTFRDKWNYEKGWARPDDPLRVRTFRPDFEGYKTKQSAPKLREELNNIFAFQVAEGVIENWEDLRQYAVEELGCEITRSGKNYLSLKLEGYDSAVRMRGEMYGEGWTAEATFDRQVQAAASFKDGRGGRVDKASADAAQRDFDTACERRASYNKSYYLTAEQRDQLALEQPEPSLRDADRGLEFAQPDLRPDEEPNAERNELDKAEPDGGFTRDTERSDDRPKGHAEPSPSGLERSADPDPARSPQDAARPDKPLDSASESEHGHSAGRGRSPAPDDVKSVAEAAMDGRRALSGVRPSGVRRSESPGPTLLIPDQQSFDDKRTDKRGSSSAGYPSEWDYLQGAGREEVYPSKRDCSPVRAERWSLQGNDDRYIRDEIDDRTYRNRKAVSAAASSSTAEPAGYAAAAQERNRSLAEAARRIAERFGKYAEQLQDWVQDTAERFRVTQRADAERLAVSQKADIRRLGGLSSQEPSVRSADVGNIGAGKPELEQISAASDKLDRSSHSLNEAFKELEAAVTAHLEIKAKRKQGHTLRM